MSGREQDSIGAFLPSIDRNLIRDLDRHLRNAAPVAEPPSRQESIRPDPVRQDPLRSEGGRPEAARQDMSRQDMARQDPTRQEAARQEIGRLEAAAAAAQQGGLRPSTSDILEAVGQAAASMAAMNARIQELEAKQAELMATNNQLRTKLSEVLQSQQGADARLRAESERAERAEEIAARHLTRCQVLEGDLSAALGDLTRIADAIHGTLSMSSSSPRRR